MKIGIGVSTLDPFLVAQTVQRHEKQSVHLDCLSLSEITKAIKKVNSILITSVASMVFFLSSRFPGLKIVFCGNPDLYTVDFADSLEWVDTRKWLPGGRRFYEFDESKFMAFLNSGHPSIDEAGARGIKPQDSFSKASLDFDRDDTFVNQLSQLVQSKALTAINLRLLINFQLRRIEQAEFSFWSMQGFDCDPARNLLGWIRSHPGRRLFDAYCDFLLNGERRSFSHILITHPSVDPQDLTFLLAFQASDKISRDYYSEYREAVSSLPDSLIFQNQKMPELVSPTSALLEKTLEETCFT